MTAIAVSIVGLASAAAADDEENFTFADEVDACVAAVDSHLDLGNADRVRHFVTNTKRTGIGYVLTIETSVFSESTEKKYAAYCVANGNNDPVKFRIDELET